MNDGGQKLRDTLLALQELLGATGAGVAGAGAAFVAVGDLDHDGAAELADGPDGVQKKASGLLVRRACAEDGFRVVTVFRFERDGGEEAEAEALALVDAAALAIARCLRRQVPEEQGFAEYELLARLGEGGMAQVHLGRHKGDPTAPLVAIKRVRSHMAKDEVFLQLFSREVQAAAQIDHPNVIKIVEYGVASRQAYMVMEYLRGATVKKLGLLAEAGSLPLSPAVVAALGRQFCAGLTAVHERGIVHCDISPPNLFVTFDGVAKLIDFGIARVATVEEGGSGDSSGTRGKVGYMAPEQLVGEPIDQRADLFSLGVVLYELLSGTAVPPSLRAYARDGLPALHEVNPALPLALCAVVMSTLSFNRHERPESAEVLDRALARACEVDGLPLLTPAALAQQLAPAFAELEPLEKKANLDPGAPTMRFD